jgi:hypothetical protein
LTGGSNVIFIEPTAQFPRNRFGRCVGGALLNTPLHAQIATNQPLNEEQLSQLVAPVALYPDKLPAKCRYVPIGVS